MAKGVDSKENGDVRIEVYDGASQKKQNGGDTSSIRKKGMTITFQDVTYMVQNVKDKKEKLSILKNVSGYFKPGELSALMGPSGSGKTTLLDTLAGRKTTGEITGSIKFAGREPNPNFLRRYTGYVEQFDTLLDMLTVREMLMYTAELKRDKKEPASEKQRVVQEWIEKLALTTCTETKIGNALARGISGGQAKRVNIGIALVSDPRVLFLDEPTSGLDSYTSNEVMTYVKNLGKDGVTICATIHSPSQYCFSLFDRAIMLVRGEVVYFGPNNKQAIEFFHAFNPHTQLIKDEGSNDAEWLTDVIVSTDREGRGSELASFFEKSKLKVQGDSELAELTKQASTIDDDMMKQLTVKKGTTVPTLKALRTLFNYRTMKNYKSPDYLGPRLGDKIITSFIIFTLYWSIGDDFDMETKGGFQQATDALPYNILAVLFMWCTLPAFGAASYVPAIVLERATFVRERSDGLYRTITYLLYKIIEELIVSTILSVVLSAVVFYAINLQGSYVSFWLIYWITLNTGIVLAYFVAAMSPNMDVANAALPAYVVTLLFFAGLLMQTSEMPSYWEWYSYIDFLRYSWMGLVRNQFDEFVDKDVAVANLVYELYEVDFMSKWGMWGINLVFYMFFFCCAWAALVFVNHSKR